MSPNFRLTQTRDDEAIEQNGDAAQPRLIRFLRADRPCDGADEFELASRDEWHLGRIDDSSHDLRAEGRICSRDDALMSSRHARIARMHGIWTVSDTSSKNGVFVNGVRIAKDHSLEDGDILECGNSFFMLREEGTGSARTASGPAPSSGKPSLAPLHYQIAPLLPLVTSPLSIHLRGETGTGKEVVARAVHDLSGRKGAFVAQNCAAIPEALFESEMFGHTKGAFSGASVAKVGQIPTAHGGTLFLDEIGELSLAAQAKLLRVLELKEVLAVGASKPAPVDFRLVSATLAHLPDMVAAGTFRKDLYARLGQTFVVPPLRSHKEHLGALIPELLAGTKLATPVPLAGVRFTIGAARAIVRSAWPLNVRQLKQCIEAALTAAANESGLDTCTIDLRHLPGSLEHRGGPIALVGTAKPPATRGPKATVSDEDILDALRRANGNRAEAARLLAVTERTIFRRLQKFREAEEP